MTIVPCLQACCMYSMHCTYNIKNTSGWVLQVVVQIIEYYTTADFCPIIWLVKRHSKSADIMHNNTGMSHVPLCISALICVHVSNIPLPSLKQILVTVVWATSEDMINDTFQELLKYENSYAAHLMEMYKLPKTEKTWLLLLCYLFSVAKMLNIWSYCVNYSILMYCLWTCCTKAMSLIDFVNNVTQVKCITGLFHFLSHP